MSNTPWGSMTGRFTDREMEWVETYTVPQLKEALRVNTSLDAMRILTELRLREDPRLDPLMQDAEVTAHWKCWASDGGFTEKDISYVIELDKKHPNLGYA